MLNTELKASHARFSFFSSSKRGVDFGLARGFSGSQALKHALGLEAARYAGGPGRKKRVDPAVGPIVE